MKLRQHVPRSIMNNMTCRYGILIGNIVPLIGNIVRGQTGSMVLIDTKMVKRSYKHVYVKMNYLFGLRTSSNPRNRQFSHSM